MLIMLRNVLYIFIEVVSTLILVRCFLSWLPLNRDNKIIDFIYQITEPLLTPARKLIEKTPLGQGDFMIDLSPILVLIVLDCVIRPLISLL